MNSGIQLKLQSSPQSLFKILLRKQGTGVLLESSDYHERYGQYSLMSTNPVAWIESCQQKITVGHGEQQAEVQGDVFVILKQLLEQYQPVVVPSVSHFTGGAIGVIGYDFCQNYWPRHHVGKPGVWPDCYFGIYPWVLVYHHQYHQYFFYGNTTEWIPLLEEYDQESDTTFDSDLNIGPLKSSVEPREYLAQIEQIQNWIRQGDVYQVNLSQQYKTKYTCSSQEPLLAEYQLYQNLMRHNPAPFSGFMPLRNQQTVLSSSPELFFSLQSGHVVMRPIKGTAPRHQERRLDEAQKIQLWNSEKDKAELMMIIDLERNDLGRVAEYGSIQVSHLQQLESYATVHHLVATIEGQLVPQAGVFDLLKATFPCGSVTGAPKLRAMERIYQLERVPRAIYTGSLGWIDFNGNAAFNVAIRTLLIHNKEITFNVGGGIVIDSIPQKEYEETLHKGQGMMRALGKD
ncbi:anthranilate synthase component I family protein [Deltaproteobacteria bacterium TL4]